MMKSKFLRRKDVVSDCADLIISKNNLLLQVTDMTFGA